MGRDHFYLIGFQAPSSLALNIFRDGTFTTSLVSLWPCITTITVNNFFLISDLNLFYFKAIPAYPGIPCSCQKSFSGSLVAHLGTGRSCKIFRKASPLWAEQPVSLSQERSSTSLIIFVAVSGLFPKGLWKSHWRNCHDEAMSEIHLTVLDDLPSLALISMGNFYAHEQERGWGQGF